MSEAGGAMRWVWGFSFVSRITEFIGVFSLSFSSIPLPTSGISGLAKPIKVGLGIRAVVDVVVAVAAAKILLAICWPNPDVPNLQVGLLLIAIAELVSMLAEYRAWAPVQNTLLQLRRAIGLGEVCAEDAKRHLDMILHGATARVFLESNISKLLREISDLRNLDKDSTAKIEEAERMLRGGPLYVAAAGALLIEINQALDGLEKRTTAAANLSKTIASEGEIIATLDRRAGNEMKDLKAQLEKEVQVAEKRVSDLRTRSKALESLRQSALGRNDPLSP
jgi:hypothetical protein